MSRGRKHGARQALPKRVGTINAKIHDFFDLTNGGGYQVYQHLLEGRGCCVGDITPTPMLAKSWTISPDGLTWTMQLRDDVKWQNLPQVNGRALTSADVAWTIDYQQAGLGKQRPLGLGITHKNRMPTPSS